MLPAKTSWASWYNEEKARNRLKQHVGVCSYWLVSTMERQTVYRLFLYHKYADDLLTYPKHGSVEQQHVLWCVWAGMEGQWPSDWRQDNCLSSVNLGLLYGATGDSLPNNIAVMEWMNGGFGSWPLLAVLLGKTRTNNLGVICSTPQTFSINDLF